MHFSLVRVVGRYIDLLVRASLHAFAISSATALIDQHDAVLGPLVDRLSRARSQARGIGAVIADSGQMKEPHFVLRQLCRAAELHHRL